MSSLDEGPHGAFIVWFDFGYDGWHPYSYDTLEEAIASAESDRSNPYVITGPVVFPAAKED